VTGLGGSPIAEEASEGKELIRFRRVGKSPKVDEKLGEFHRRVPVLVSRGEVRRRTNMGGGGKITVQRQGKSVKYRRQGLGAG